MACDRVRDSHSGKDKSGYVPSVPASFRQAVGIGGENDLSTIPPLRNMMWDIDGDHARKASHTKNIAKIFYVSASMGAIFRLGIPRLERKNGVRPVCPRFSRWR